MSNAAFKSKESRNVILPWLRLILMLSIRKGRACSDERSKLSICGKILRILINRILSNILDTYGSINMEVFFSGFELGMIWVFRQGKGNWSRDMHTFERKVKNKKKVFEVRRISSTNKGKQSETDDFFIGARHNDFSYIIYGSLWCLCLMFKIIWKV